jgi:hypothetical protein
MSDIPAPPQKVLDCFAALQNVADNRSQRRHTGALHKMLDASSAEQNAGVGAVAKATKNPQGPESKLSLLVPQH